MLTLDASMGSSLSSPANKGVLLHPHIHQLILTNELPQQTELLSSLISQFHVSYLLDFGKIQRTAVNHSFLVTLSGLFPGNYHSFGIYLITHQPSLDPLWIFAQSLSTQLFSSTSCLSFLDSSCHFTHGGESYFEDPERTSAFSSSLPKAHWGHSDGT